MGSRTREGVPQGSPPVKVSHCQAEALGLYQRRGQCLRPQRAGASCVFFQVLMHVGYLLNSQGPPPIKLDPGSLAFM